MINILGCLNFNIRVVRNLAIMDKVSPSFEGWCREDQRSGWVISVRHLSKTYLKKNECFALLWPRILDRISFFPYVYAFIVFLSGISLSLSLSLPAAPQVDFSDRKGLRFCRGDTIKVRIPISGTPTPRTTWSRGREIIDIGSRRGRADITGTNLHTTMIIEDCVKSDEGSYTLLVENKLGSVSVDVPIWVVGEWQTRLEV